MVVYTRFRVLPDRQMESIQAYLDSGRPVVGLRTSTHAFRSPADSNWHAWNDGFGRDVFGTPWISHHGHSSRTDVSILAPAEGHPILRGVDSRFRVRSWLYHVLPLSKPCRQLLWGKPVQPECPPCENPVAWTTVHNQARVFFTTLGHPDDFEIPAFRLLLANGIRWAAGDLD
jgi:type 1 glutamine amidotransferase